MTDTQQKLAAKKFAEYWPMKPMDMTQKPSVGIFLRCWQRCDSCRFIHISAL